MLTREVTLYSNLQVFVVNGNFQFL